MMLSFGQPLALFFLPMAGVVAWGWWRGRRSALRYSSLGLVHGLPQGRARLARRVGAMARGLIVAGLVLAFADPRLPDRKTRLPAEGISIALVLDVSGSMAEPDFGASDKPAISRLDAAKSAFRLFVAGGVAPDGSTLDSRPGDRIGLVTFSAVPETACPLTLNHSVLLKLLDEQKPESGANAGTNIGDALAEAVIRLEGAGSKRRKVMILLSDGEHNAIGEKVLTPLAAAQLAAHFGIPIYTIDCGGESDRATTPDNIKARTDGRANLAAVAELTQARSFTANDADELLAVCKTIDQLERVRDPGTTYRRYHHFGPWCGIAAAIVLILLMLAEATVWRRVPT